MSRKSLSLSSQSPEETAALAVVLAAMLNPGDVLLLEGDIGAGKTHFARALIQSLLDTPEDVPSPTFTLVQTYETQVSEIWHADLYRLTDPSEVVELGLTDAFDESICLVEWPDRLAELAPVSAVTITFALGTEEGQRNLQFTWTDVGWDKRMQDITS